MKSAMKLGLLAGALAIGIAGTVMGQPGATDQLQMAMNNLNSARDHVLAANKDPQGHNERAMMRIYQAIDEVRGSMQERREGREERREERREDRH